MTSGARSPLFLADDTLELGNATQGDGSSPSLTPSPSVESCVSRDDTIKNNNDLLEPLLPSSSDTVSESLSSQEDNDDSSGLPEPPPWKGLFFFRFLYFLSGLSGVTWGRFGVIFYNTVKHLSSREIGTIQGIMKIISFFAMPVWGWVADRIRSRKRVYLFCDVCSTIALLCMALPITNGFWPIFFAAGGMTVFRPSGVLDAHAIDFLGDENKELYGSIRIYASISWGIGAVILGYITDSLGFEYNFILFGVMYSLQIIFVAIGLPARSKQEQARYDSATETAPKWEVLFKALFRLPVIIWLIEIALAGAGISLVDTFLFVFMQNDLNASTVLCGYSVIIAVLFELPIFAFSRPLLQKVGHDVLFIVAMAAYVVRALGYTFLTPSTAYVVLCCEFLHGITLACMWIASVDFSAAVAPDEWATTVQSILGTVMWCVGGGIGPIVGGAIMDAKGARYMYRCAGWMVGFTGLFHCVLCLFGRGHNAFLLKLQTEKAAAATAANQIKN